MAYNQDIEHRIDALLETYPSNVGSNFTKKKMFSGLAYLYFGKMTVGIVGDQLMVRVVGAKMKQVLATPFVRPMDFTGKPMKEFVYVHQDGITMDSDLEYWLQLGLEHAQTKLSRS